MEQTAKAVKKAIEEGSYFKMNSKSKKKVHIFSLGPVEGVEDILEKLEDINEREAPEPVAVKDTRNDDCIVFWTSGTTGLPKGIVHSHFSTLNFFGFLESTIQPNTPIVATTCFFHVGGFMAGIVALKEGVTFYHVSLNPYDHSKY